MSLNFIAFNSLMVLLVLFFDFGLAGNKRFNINRITLILIPFVSLLIYVPLGFSSGNVLVDTFQIFLPEYSVLGSNEEVQIGFSGLLYLYIIMTTLLLTRSLIILIKDYKAGTPTELNSTAIRVISKGGSYSLFNRIYLAPEDLNNSLILNHEQAHVAQKHSLDIVFANLVTSLLWFNPIVWRWKILIQQNHEYLADEVILNGSTDQAREYIHLLLDRALNTNQFSLGNYFSLNSLISKRIIMVNKKVKQKKWRTALMLGLMIGSTVYISACNKDANSDGPIDSQETKEERVIEVEKEVYSKVDIMPEFPGGQEALYTYLGQNLKYPEECKSEGIEGIVYISFIIDVNGEITDVKTIKGIHKALDEEAEKAISLMPKWTPGKKEGKEVNVIYNMPIRFQMKKED